MHRAGWKDERKHRTCRVATVIGAMIVSGCAPGTRLFSPGPRPMELAVAWIDSASTTARDTVVWVLAPSGEDRRLMLSVRRDALGRETIRRGEKSAGIWYLQGSLTDTTQRAICYKKRARDGGPCVHFTLDSIRLANGTQRRRLTVRDFPGASDPLPRVFFAARP